MIPSTPATRVVSMLALVAMSGCGGDIAPSPPPLTHTLDLAVCSDPSAPPATPYQGICLKDDLAKLAARAGACVLLYAERVEGSCFCDPALGRRPVSASAREAADGLLASARGESQAWNCACEIAPLSVPPSACTPAADAGIDGWCFAPLPNDASPSSSKCVQAGATGELSLLGHARIDAPSASSSCVGVRFACADAS